MGVLRLLFPHQDLNMNGVKGLVISRRWLAKPEESFVNIMDEFSGSRDGEEQRFQWKADFGNVKLFVFRCAILFVSSCLY